MGMRRDLATEGVARGWAAERPRRPDAAPSALPRDALLLGRRSRTLGSNWYRVATTAGHIARPAVGLPTVCAETSVCASAL